MFGGSDEKNRYDKRKPFTIHLSLFVLLLFYATLGGVVFHYLEASATKQYHEVLQREKLDCVTRVLSAANSSKHSEVAELTLACWKTTSDERAEWGIVSATLFGFGIITTLGYNKLHPITTNGRLFCMVYGIIGIPLTMIVIASVGQYFRKFAGKCREKMKSHKVRRRLSLIFKSESESVEEEEEEDSPEMVALFVLVVFLVYIAFGTMLLPLLDNEVDFVNGLYFNFLCLIAMDFSGLVPPRTIFLPITFIYICIGLAITTLAIEIGSDYMRRLHHFGERVRNVATTKIRFGGKKLNVRDLLHAVGRKCGIDPSEIDGINLDQVVQKAINTKKGSDTHDDDEKPPPASVPQKKKSEIISMIPKSKDEDDDQPPAFRFASPQIVINEVDETPEEPETERPKSRQAYEGIVASRTKMYAYRLEQDNKKAEKYRRNSSNPTLRQGWRRMSEYDSTRRHSEQSVKAKDNTFADCDPL